ncbi:MAG TPA: Mut7-C RNAse domain-containing protein [Nitrososphaera sp.]
MSAKCAGARRPALRQNDVTFVADSMLGGIARKLRIFGFNTLYVKNADDGEILKIGVNQGRVILTADREFFKRIVKAGVPGVLVAGKDEVEDLVHILSKNGIRSAKGRIGSRCSICNGLLAPMETGSAKGSVPEKVAASHQDFFQCIECSKVFWEGSHMNRIRALVKLVDSRLDNNVRD